MIKKDKNKKKEQKKKKQKDYQLALAETPEGLALQQERDAQQKKERQETIIKEIKVFIEKMPLLNSEKFEELAKFLNSNWLSYSYNKGERFYQEFKVFFEKISLLDDDAKKQIVKETSNLLYDKMLRSKILDNETKFPGIIGFDKYSGGTDGVYQRSVADRDLLLKLESAYASVENYNKNFDEKIEGIKSLKQNFDNFAQSLLDSISDEDSGFSVYSKMLLVCATLGIEYWRSSLFSNISLLHETSPDLGRILALMNEVTQENVKSYKKEDFGRLLTMINDMFTGKISHLRSLHDKSNTDNSKVYFSLGRIQENIDCFNKNINLAETNKELFLEKLMNKLNNLSEGARCKLTINQEITFVPEIGQAYLDNFSNKHIYFHKKPERLPNTTNDKNEQARQAWTMIGLSQPMKFFNSHSPYLEVVLSPEELYTTIGRIKEKGKEELRKIGISDPSSLEQEVATKYETQSRLFKIYEIIKENFSIDLTKITFDSFLKIFYQPAEIKKFFDEKLYPRPELSFTNLKDLKDKIEEISKYDLEGLKKIKINQTDYYVTQQEQENIEKIRRDLLDLSDSPKLQTIIGGGKTLSFWFKV